MAQDEVCSSVHLSFSYDEHVSQVFSGPMSESVPSSVTGFAHRHPKSESAATFAYFQEDDESPAWSEDQAILDEDEDPNETTNEDIEAEIDLESTRKRAQPRKYSAYSRSSLEDPLLYRRASAKSGTSGLRIDARKSQKIYVVSEDLTFVMAGFTTSRIGFAIYISLCISSFGLAYLALRWLPRWKVNLVGKPTALRECDWLVIEVSPPRRSSRSGRPAKSHQSQWGEMSVHRLSRVPRSHVTATLFATQSDGLPTSEYYDDDDDDRRDIIFLEYRYLRFWFCTGKDKFLMCDDWTDPEWRDIKAMRRGLKSDEWAKREAVFGKNQISIDEKSIPALLVEEVCAYNDYDRQKLIVC